MNKKTITSILILLIVGAFVVYLYSSLSEMAEIDQQIEENTPIEKTNLPEVAIFADGEQCYTYSHAATTNEPYKVSETMKINVRGGLATGTKSGTQEGPDMNNGYNGTLTGTIREGMLDVVFAYTIEGSQNKEKEIYRPRADQTGIEKLRYPLVEEKGILVPDTTKEMKVMFYSKVGCTASN